MAGEQIRAILGVPLTVEGEVIGALLAVHRTVRPFPAGEVDLLTSFAAHAAVALENARLFEQAGVAAAAAAAAANAELRARSEATECAAHAHDLLSDLVSSVELGADRVRERARQQGADLDAHLAVVLAPAEPLAVGETVRDRLGGATVGVAARDGWGRAPAGRPRLTSRHCARARSPRPAFSAVSAMRALRVSARFAVTIHSRMLRLAERVKPSQLSRDPGWRSNAAARSSGTTRASTSSSSDQVPFCFAASTAACPATPIRPSARRRSTLALFGPDQPLVVRLGVN
ncbi:MAG: hypothetical protein JWQ15_379 [Marmoricola sp.]|nr:hypothetical protein [Marmoricola sp.]